MKTPRSKRAAEAQKLLNLGLFKEAVRELEKGLQEDPRDAEALLGLARLRLAKHEREAAKPLLVRLLELHPSHAESISHLARMKAEEGDDGRALDVLRELAARKEAGFFEFYNLGLVLLQQGQLDEAGQAFVQALKVEKNNPQALTYLGLVLHRQGDHERAYRCYRTASGLAPTESLPLKLAARLQLERGRFAQATKLLEVAIETAPDKLELREEHAKLLIFHGKPKDALRAALDLRRKAPADPRWMYLHGLAALTAGMLPEAERVLEEARAAAPAAWEIRLALGKVYSLAKQPAKAQEVLEEAVRLAPTEPGPASDLALLYLQSPEGAQRARSVLAPVLEAHPDHAGTHLNMALALARSDAQAAAAHARKAQASEKADIREQATRLLAQVAA